MKHVEAHASLLQALRREVEKETGWRIWGLPTLLHVEDWMGDGPKPRREFDFSVTWRAISITPGSSTQNRGVSLNQIPARTNPCAYATHHTMRHRHGKACAKKRPAQWRCL